MTTGPLVEPATIDGRVLSTRRRRNRSARETVILRGWKSSSIHSHAGCIHVESFSLASRQPVAGDEELEACVARVLESLRVAPIEGAIATISASLSTQTLD